MEQQSFDWLKWRQEGIGASDAPIIMGLSPYKTPYQLWEEKTGQIDDKPANTFVQQKGLEYEKRARILYLLETGIQAEPMLVQWSEHPVLRASLDGYCEEKKVIFEAKYVGEDVFEKGQVVEHHWPQVQHQMLCTDAERVDYVMYSEKTDSIKIIPVKPDPIYHAQLVEAELKFWALVKSKTPPELSDRDFKPVKDKELIDLVSNFQSLTMQIKDLENQQKEMKEKITSHEHVISNRRVCVGDAKIYKVIRKGNVDYGKIPVLKGVDLEPYRKTSTEFWTIK